MKIKFRRWKQAMGPKNVFGMPIISGRRFGLFGITIDISFFLLLIVLVSCSRINPAQPTQDSYLTYYFSGNTVKHEGSYSSYTASGNGAFVAKINFPRAIYKIDGYSGPNNSIRIQLECDSLVNDQQGQSIIVYQSKSFAGSVSVLASCSNGLAEGSFSGKYFNVINHNDSINVVGQFKGLQILY